MFKKDCERCSKASLERHEKAKYWSKKNTLSPRQVSINCNSKHWFDCDKCPHDFYVRVTDITSKKQWCPYCGGQKLCDKKCKLCFNRSLAAFHDKAKLACWSKKNTCTPRQVMLHSGRKFWFDCDKCLHDFSTCISDMVSKNTWCPTRKNKTERSLYEYVKSIYPETICQAKFPWAINPLTNKNFSFDILIESHKIIIEIDGPQHFRQIANWESPETILTRDIIKEIFACENGYTVIRLLQQEVKFKRCTYWKKFLDMAIERSICRKTPWLLCIERELLMERDRENCMNFILEHATG
jgi:very-short-patch-repair endonuclease